MPTAQRPPENSEHTNRQAGSGDADVRAMLELILQSQPFRTSRQCQNLLSYIVEHSLHDDDASLRERILGIEVFGRSPSYDTSEDPVVRMRAADVRKRLAQFYQGHEPHEAGRVVHIELKPGSYRATFYCQQDAKDEASRGQSAELETRHHQAVGEPNVPVLLDAKELGLANRRTSPGSLTVRRRWAVIIVCGLVALMLGLGGWRFWAAHSLTPQQRFWGPLINAKQTVLLYVGANVAYRFTPEYMAQYQKQHNLDVNGPEFFVDLQKGMEIRAEDLYPVRNTFVSVADLAAATEVVKLMNGWGKPFNLRSAGDLSMGDIRNTPSILIGGFNNPWTLETTNDLPYSFRDGVRIENRADPAHSWRVVSTAGGASTEDFALISRLLRANTGGPVVSIGGIGSYGTQAVAEFVTSPEKMNELLKSAPSGWENKNMQAVLRIKVVAFAPVAVDVVATSYW